MIRRSVLFILAAATATGCGAAHAADEPPAPPVDFARLCAAFGSAFHAVPGTETCVRMGGRVRADAVLADGPGATAEDHNFATRSRGTVYLETRTPTDFGLVRTYIEMEAAVGPSD